MGKGLLVPFDGSENALEALRFAVTLAKPLAEKIIVLNVQPRFRTIHTKMFFSESAIREYQEQLFQEAIASAEELLKNSGVDYEIKFRVGEAKEQILLEVADDLEQTSCLESKVRMIIMGSRGMNPILGKILGSVSYAVVNETICPVTIVPACNIDSKE